MLQKPEDNPHATLLSLFLNAVHEIAGRRYDKKRTESEVMRVMPYMSFSERPQSPYDPKAILLMSALPLVMEAERMFNQ